MQKLSLSRESNWPTKMKFKKRKSMELNVPIPHHEGYFLLEGCQSQGNVKSALRMILVPILLVLLRFLWRQMKRPINCQKDPIYPSLHMMSLMCTLLLFSFHCIILWFCKTVYQLPSSKKKGKKEDVF